MHDNIRIGVTTFINDNYGTALQAYSLQHVLKERGVEPYIFDSTKAYARSSTSRDSFLKWYARSPYYGRIMQIRLRMSRNKFSSKREKVLSFVENNIDIVRPTSYRDFIDTLKSTQAMIAGSDQLWNPNAPIRDDFFLNYPRYDLFPKFTYAVSLGVNSLTEEQKNLFIRKTKGFQCISVRESSGAQCLESLVSSPVRVDVDPTILPGRSLWEKISTPYPIKQTNYILVYMLRPDPRTMSIAKRLSREVGLPIYYIGNLFIYDNDVENIPDASVTEFLWLVNNAQYIVTNSFHGTVFSVQFHKKFLSVALAGTGDRAKEFLCKVGLIDHLCRPDALVQEKIEMAISNNSDYNNVDYCLNDNRRSSLKYIDEIVAAAKEAKTNMFSKHVSSYHSADCSGCGVCLNVCHKKAISIQQNEFGFLHAVVDETNCIQCGECQRVCPLINYAKTHTPIEAYAAALKDRTELFASTSGGIFYALGLHVIDNGGHVYGCSQLRENGVLVTKHICASSIEDLQKCRGAKYVQSDTATIYPKVKKDLDSGIQVLFSGTPCQVSALKNYLHRDYENLLTVDLVCHGVPSEKMFHDYIELFERENNCKVKEYYFRSKMFGWTAEHIKIVTDSFVSHHYCYALSFPYYFLKTMSYRDSCYACRYAQKNRIGDLTIGDFWGIEYTDPYLLKKKIFSEKCGISCILCNTEKGRLSLSAIDNRATFRLVPVEHPPIYNGSLRNPCLPPKGREELLNSYAKFGYLYLENQYRKIFRQNYIWFKLISISPYYVVKIQKQIKQLSSRILAIIRRQKTGR